MPSLRDVSKIPKSLGYRVIEDCLDAGRSWLCRTKPLEEEMMKLAGSAGTTGREISLLPGIVVEVVQLVASVG